MRAYSMDLRERVIENLEHESMRKTAKRFGVSDYFVYRLKQRYREAGALAPKPHGGGHWPLVDEAGGEFLRVSPRFVRKYTLRAYLYFLTVLVEILKVFATVLIDCFAAIIS